MIDHVHHRIEEKIEVFLAIGDAAELVHHAEEPAKFIVVEGGSCFAHLPPSVKFEAIHQSAWKDEFIE
ncbi:MAG: hypothetical protein ACYDC6_15125 [Acidobacteriaceae bacterium]